MALAQSQPTYLKAAAASRPLPSGRRSRITGNIRDLRPDGNGLEAAAAFKCVGCDWAKAIQHGGMFKAASGKRIKPNICDAVRNHDTGQAVAELKREFSDARHSLADRHNCRGGAQLEREIPNGDHAVRNVDARQRSARVE